MRQKPAGEGNVVLLTGFPGFIGERLLPRLLEVRPDEGFLCLVQPKFQGVAEAALRRLEAGDPKHRGRVATVAGDITLDRLGLAPSEARALQRRVVGCYHLAAVYDLAVGRNLALKVNVEGTRRVLRFLEGAPRLVRLDYVSTAYVSGTATGIFRESDLDVGQGFRNHYEETKFQAEVDVAASGLPRAVYRPGIVVGDSRNGETAKFDGPYFVLSAMDRVPSPGLFVRIGSGRSAANLVPVDFVVEALARLSSSPAATGKTYHLTDDEPLSAFELEELFARALGKRFVYLPLPARTARILLKPRPLQKILGMPAQVLDYFDHPCRYDSSAAREDLGRLGLSCPRVSDYVGRLVDFYRRKKKETRTEAMA
jgi:thioester reductase-like protein